jgi:hypothetical protein
MDRIDFDRLGMPLEELCAAISSYLDNGYVREDILAVFRDLIRRSPWSDRITLMELREDLWKLLVVTTDYGAGLAKITKMEVTDGQHGICSNSQPWYFY